MSPKFKTVALWTSAVALFMVFALTLCASIPQLLSFLRSPADRAIQEDDIRESVFRNRLEHVQGNGPFASWSATHCEVSRTKILQQKKKSASDSGGPKPFVV